MKIDINSFGLLQYFPSVRLLLSHLESLEQDVKNLKEENKTLRAEMRKERELGRTGLESLIDKFTAPPPLTATDEYMLQFLQQPGESDEAYAERIKKTQPSAKEFRNHNQILSEAYDAHERIARVVENEERAKRASVVIGASKQREIIGRAKDIRGQ